MSIEVSMRIALIGTRGVPAHYGGFETAVDEIGRRLVRRGHEVVVYCRYGQDVVPQYEGMRLVHLPAVRKNSLETLSHTALSMVHAWFANIDAAIVFNAANAPLLPLLKAARISAAVHVDGLEWRRAKWGPVGSRYYQVAERLAVRWADALIADAWAIRQYYLDRYGADAVFLPYGAPELRAPDADRLTDLGVEPGAFHLLVARFEPENHVDTIIDGFVSSNARLPLIVVGRAAYSHAYDAQIRVAAGNDPRVHLVGAIWDDDLLNQLYGNCLTYLHGHSVGGTNPSLLRALGAGAGIISYDVAFNREVAAEDGVYFATEAQLAAAVEGAEAHPDLTRQRGLAGRERAVGLYDWDEVSLGYERLCHRLFDYQHDAAGPRRLVVPRSHRAAADDPIDPGRPLTLNGRRAEQERRRLREERRRVRQGERLAEMERRAATLGERRSTTDRRHLGGERRR
jgi:glycosyltransferase involved in cell wall biosynthesis